ncbi:MAG: hypothetical protein JSW04_06840, partial [Desulfobacterales bacterium]
MTLIKIMMVIALICLPATAWCAHLKYDLDVNINTADDKVIGLARLRSDIDRQVRLSVFNLRRLKVDGHVVNTNSDQTISLTLSRGKDVVITYEALFNDKQVN